MRASSPNKALILAALCLTTGTLDGAAAILISYKFPASAVFQYIASGWFGQTAFTGGSSMVVWGVVFHYLIASFYSVLFFILYPTVIKILKNKFLVAFIYGVLIWAIMKFVVLPLTNVPKSPTHFHIISFLKGLSPLVLCVGLPVVLFADKYYRKAFLKNTVD